MMRSYTAYCTNEDGENLCMTREYTSKAHFISDLHGNGYKVHFVALADKYDEECAKYYERLETKRRRAAIRRECEREWKRRDAEIEKAATEETNEEPQQEDKHMKKRFFYLADIGSTFAVTPMTKKEIISIGQELKELCAFISDDQTISGYTKDGRFFYYDYSNFDSFKKSDIINAVSVIYSDESGDYYWGGFDINEWGVAGPTEDGSTIIADHENLKEVDNEDYHEPAADQAEEPAAEQPEETAPDFEAVKDQLFAKVEHIDAENAGAFADQTTVWRKRGEDIAHSIWFNGERLKRDTMNAWEETGISETEVFKVAMENTMATEKPRIHRNIFDIEREPLESTALLESWFTLQKLDDDKTVLVTTSDKKDNGAIAAFYPPVLAKICELFGGSGFYIAFTSVHEGMIHKLGSIDPSSIRRNVQETNRIFGPSDTLSDDVFYYDPQIKKLDIVPA